MATSWPTSTATTCGPTRCSTRVRSATSADEQAAVELFCPVPQMVGGGTVHWQGWLPRFTAERLPAAQHRRRRTRAPRWPTGRSPMTSWSPTTTRSSGPSASRARPGRTRSRGGAAGATRARRCRMSRYAREVPPGLRGARLELVPHAAGRAVPAVQRPPADGHQRLRPAARRPDRHPVQRAQRLRPGRGRDRPLRPAAGLLRPRAHRSTSTAGVKGAVYEDADGDVVEQEADVVHPGLRRRGDRPAAAAVHSPAASRTGWPTAATWSAATSPSTSTAPRWAPSTTRSTPGPAAATSAPAASSSTSTTTRRGFVSGGHIAAAGVGIPLPINWRLPGRPDLGRRGQADRPRATSTTAWRSAMVRARHAAARQPGRPRRRVSSTPGACRSPGSPSSPHENDLTQGRFLIDRNAEILEAAGAKHGPEGLHRPDHRQLLAPARHHADGRRPGDARSSTAGAARTRSTTSSSSTAARSRPAPAPTRR